MRIAFFATVAALICAVPASAADLITNGGFETGDTTGFSVIATATGAAPSGFFGLNAHSGAFFLALGDLTTTYPFGVVSQTVTDTPGDTLTLSYWFASAGGSPNFFEALWNAMVLPGSTIIDTGPSDYTFFQFSVIGTGTDILSFHEQNPLAYSAIDEISLEATTLMPPADTGVPEPASLGLFALALLALGVSRLLPGRHSLKGGSRPFIVT